jgi:endonuclease YncB( thermonuclease family)
LDPSQAQLSVIDGPVDARVDAVIDGDTIRATVYKWPGETEEEVFRIRGLDSPEMRGDCQAEKDLARAAKLYLESIIKENKNMVRLTLIGCNSTEGGGFGRCLANVSVGSVLVSDELIRAGLARPNFGEKRSGWC